MWYLGLMSGTSLDGVDLALCRFRRTDIGATYEIAKAATIPYPQEWEDRLRAAMSAGGRELTLLDRDLGRYLGILAKAFLQDCNLEGSLVIASHGHTVFHEPALGMTLQIGHGPSMREAAGFPVLTDFRSADVAAAGQGAPLVPVADKDLFAQYPICLNLGGFANVTLKTGGGITAFDVCPCNTVLNDLANKLGFAYDDGGGIALSGKVIPTLLDALDKLPHYSQAIKTSLGREFVAKAIHPLLGDYASEKVEDLLCTYTYHVANTISQAVYGMGGGHAIVTGGGAYNDFLLELLREKAPLITWTLPKTELISFKEALAFAYLGYLYSHNLPGNLPEVTGAVGPRVLGSYCP
jgi:anhydro-N-acetylmuramic acid kinase